MKGHPGGLRRWSTPLIMVVIAAGYGLTLLIFYPGIMTYDARYVHTDALQGTFGDWQSPVMTALWAAIDPIAPGAASMFLLITTLYWLGFATLALGLAHRSFTAALVMVLMALTPPALIFVGIIWRDVLFAAVWILAAAMAWSIAERRDALRYGVQVLAMVMLVFGFLLRPNALFATPLLAATIIWPNRFELRRTALLYVPVIIACYALIPTVYYGVFAAKRQNALHSILVFDLGGITHFTRQNQFPVTWTANQEELLTDSCYQPAAWDYYWTTGPCTFVMERLENDKIFGSPILAAAWWRSVATHPLAYLQHRLSFMEQFLFGNNPTLWTIDIEHPDQMVFADNPWFVVIKDVHDVLKPTPLFRAATWLFVCVALCGLSWPRRDRPTGVFVLGVCGSAIVYLATFLPFGVAADFRYAYFAVLAALTSSVLLASDADPMAERATVAVPAHDVNGACAAAK
jgi:preprotein translocase subunit SecE